MEDHPLSAQERETLAAIADHLIPAAESMPSFSEIGAEKTLTARVLELRPELLTDLRRALAQAAGADPAEAAERLNRDDPVALGTLGLVASSAYYLAPEVRQRLAYPGQQSRPASPEEEHDYLRDDLLQPVIDRGPIYREAPD